MGGLGDCLISYITWILFIFVLTFIKDSSCSVVTSEKFQKSTNERFVGTTLTTLTARSELECCLACLNSENLYCRMVNFNLADMTCEFFQSSQSVATQAGWNSVVVREPGCGDWMEYGGRCYMAVLTHANWEDSKTVCEGLGGTLANIYTSDRFEFLAAKFATGDAWQFWVGGYDYNGDNTGWKWMDGFNIDLSFYGWKANEPNSPGERCLEFVRSGATFVYNDHMCTNSYKSICERQP